MNAPHKHTIHEGQSHFGWNNANKPIVTVKPGESIEFHPMDASAGQLSQKSTTADVAKLDFSKVNPVVGPVYVDGAEPGDAIKVTLLSFAPSGWGWTANIPGFGLLADQFKEPALHIWKYDAQSLVPAMFGPGGRVPLKPFCGTIGLAPAEPGQHSIVPPRQVGGNMDIRDMSAGTELYLPVEVKGGVFSVGDTHASQGDGEVCGTAIESPIALAAKFDLVKGANLKFPRFTTRCQGLRGDHGHQPRSDDGRQGGGERNGRPAVQALQDAAGRGLYALQCLRRPAHQRNRRHAQLDRVVLLPARGVRVNPAGRPRGVAPQEAIDIGAALCGRPLLA